MVNLVLWIFLPRKDPPTRKTGGGHIYGSLCVLGQTRVVKNDRVVHVVVFFFGGGVEGPEMRHGVNLRVGLAIVVRVSKDTREKGV